MRADPPHPAVEIADDLQTALDQFTAIVEDLDEDAASG